MTANGIEPAEAAPGENALLEDVSPDIKHRDMLDAIMLAEAATAPGIPRHQKIDLWGQALFIAFGHVPSSPREIKTWATSAVHMAWEQLESRLKQLELEPEQTEHYKTEPLLAIHQVYSTSSFLFQDDEQFGKNEAYRVSQLYYYFSLVNLFNAGRDEISGARAYTLGIGTQAVQFAFSAECFFECIGIARSTCRLFRELDEDGWLERQSPEIQQRLYQDRFFVGYYAASAAEQIQELSEALEWTVLAEPYLHTVNNTELTNDYFKKRGEVLNRLGKKKEAQEWLRKRKKARGTP